jgi:hypothetical protein
MSEGLGEHIKTKQLYLDFRSRERNTSLTSMQLNGAPRSGGAYTKVILVVIR